MERFEIMWNQLMDDPLGVLLVAVILLLIALLVTKTCSVMARRMQIKRNMRTDSFGLWDGRRYRSVRDKDAAILKEFKSGLRDIEKLLARQPH